MDALHVPARSSGFSRSGQPEGGTPYRPLQCDICEGIRIVPMLLDVPTLRRNKFHDPRFMGPRRVNFRVEALVEPCHANGRRCCSALIFWLCSSTALPKMRFMQNDTVLKTHHGANRPPVFKSKSRGLAVLRSLTIKRLFSTVIRPTPA